MIEKDQRQAYWRKTTLLMASVLLVTAACLILLAPLSPLLNTVTTTTFPLGFYLMAQGIPIACVIAAFWFAIRQERTDRQHGAMEDM